MTNAILWKVQVEAAVERELLIAAPDISMALRVAILNVNNCEGAIKSITRLGPVLIVGVNDGN